MQVNSALVLQGGAMRIMFTAGVLDAFIEEDLFFPYIVGVSAGAAAGLAFLARKEGHACRTNLSYGRDPRFMGLRHYRKSGTYFNFDFIYDELPHRLDSFDYEDLFQAREEMEIGTTNCLTGGADYFSFQEAKKSKDFRIFLRSLYASCSVPCLCRPICIHKVPYLDGGIASPIPYARALEQGYSQQVVILTQPLRHLHRTRVRSLPPRWIYRNAYPCIAALCKHYDEIYNQAAADLLKNASHGHVVLIAPETDFVVHLAERNRSKLVRLYFHGFKKGKSLAKEIRSRKV